MRKVTYKSASHQRLHEFLSERFRGNVYRAYTPAGIVKFVKEKGETLGSRYCTQLGKSRLLRDDQKSVLRGLFDDTIETWRARIKWSNRRNMDQDAKDRRRCENDPVFRKKNYDEIVEKTQLYGFFTVKEYAEASKHSRRAYEIGVNDDNTEVKYPEGCHSLGVGRLEMQAKSRRKDFWAYNTEDSPNRYRPNPEPTRWTGRRPRTRRSEDRVYVRCHGFIQRDDHHLLVKLEEPDFPAVLELFSVPAGWRFATTGVNGHGGLCVQNVENKDMDFHFNFHDLRYAASVSGSTFVTLLLDKAESNYIRRMKQEEEARKQALEDKKLMGELGEVWVCVADSIRAGNCAMGTKSFIKQHKIEGKHIPATKLVEIMEDLPVSSYDYRRIKTTLWMAKKQYIMEMRRGYARLEDHCYEQAM